MKTYITLLMIIIGSVWLSYILQNNYSLVGSYVSRTAINDGKLFTMGNLSLSGCKKLANNFLAYQDHVDSGYMWHQIKCINQSTGEYQ